MAKVRLRGDFSGVELSPNGHRAVRNKKVRVRTAAVPAAKPKLVSRLNGLRSEADGHLERLLEQHVSLVKTYKDGIRPLDALPGSAGAIFRGKRHLEAAPPKDGKSFAELVRAVDMVRAGCRVVILDRENGRDVYGERLELIVRAREWGAEEERLLEENLVYFEFPVFTRQHQSGEALVEVALAIAADLVIFDSQRWFLTDMDLSEDDSDDYSLFMNVTVDLLFRQNVATLVLDNVGHDRTERSRGSSAKQDLHDHVYTFKKTKPFDRKTRGHVTLTTLRSRLGVSDSFMLELGGGHIGQWRRIGEVETIDLPTGVRRVMEQEAQKIDVGKPKLSYRQLRERLRVAGAKFDNTKLREELEDLVQDRGFPLKQRTKRDPYTWGA